MADTEKKDAVVNQIKPGQDVYHKIELPPELSDTVTQAIASVNKKKVIKNSRRKKAFNGFKLAGSIAAALFIAAVVGLNTNRTFSEAVSEVPLLGSLSRVLTVRSYTEQQDNTTITVKVPEVLRNEEKDGKEYAAAGSVSTAGNDSAAKSLQNEPSQMEKDTGQEEALFVADVNAEINRLVEEYIANAKQHIDEYKEAFLSTGGTEEEWAQRDNSIQVTYDIKYQQGPYLSFVLYNSESWTGFMEERVYYNLDLENNRNLTLKDLLGEDYVSIANQSILAQMEERTAREDAVYWGQGEEDFWEGFTTVDDTTLFYINSKGNPVICFEKYEIGPGYLGMQEFEIPKP